MIDYRYIEAFLAVVNTNSLSKAAESMYVSQSSISKWICQLEEEIGVELIVRHKGQRSIELTASGKELVPLAEEWMNLHGQIIGMKEHNRTSIRIVSVDSLNNTLMPPIYQELLRTDPELELSVLTGQSPDIYSMVERKQYDVGIVTVELHSPSLIVTPLLTEPFELLLYSEKEVDTSAPVTPDSLDVRKNLYIPSGYSLRQWHEYWFPHWQKLSLGRSADSGKNALLRGRTLDGRTAERSRAAFQTAACASPANDLVPIPKKHLLYYPQISAGQL